MTDMNTIPTLDLRRFKTDPEGFVQEMGAAYQAWGFAGITGHGIDASVALNALRAAEKIGRASCRERVLPTV